MQEVSVRPPETCVAEAAMPPKPGEKNDSDKKAMNEQCFECLGILE